MDIKLLGLIVIGIVLIVLGLFAKIQQKNISIKNLKGSLIIAKKVSNVKQTYAQKGPTDKESSLGIRDVIPWLLSFIGLALTAVGLMLQYSEMVNYLKQCSR